MIRGTDKRFQPCSEEKKRKISETLSGSDQGAQFIPRPEDGEQLRAAVSTGENFKYQKIIDLYRDGFALPEHGGTGRLVRPINGEGEEF